MSPSVWRGWADALEQPRAGPAEGVNKPVAGMQQEAAVPAAEPREAPLERGRLPLFPAHLGTPLAAARCEALQVACPTHAHSRADGSCHAQVLPEDWAEFDEGMRGKKAGPEPSAPPPFFLPSGHAPVCPTSRSLLPRVTNEIVRVSHAGPLERSPRPLSSNPTAVRRVLASSSCELAR